MAAGIVLALMLAALGWPAAAQTNALPFAAVTQDQLMLYGLGDAPVAVTAPGAYWDYAQLAWSPDGSTLAFIGIDSEYKEHLLITDRAGSPPVDLPGTPARMFPVSFSADGQIVYAEDTGQFMTLGEGPGGTVVNVQSIAPTAGAVPATLSQFTWGVGCGGGSSIPAHWLYWSETEGSPGNSPLALAVTPSGIVHSINCTGIGTALLDPATGTDTELGTQLGWVSVSPDGSRLVGISKERGDPPYAQMLTIDLATRAVTPIAAAASVMPDLVVWGADGNSIFYSTLQASGNVIPATPEEQQILGEAIGSMEPATLPLNIVTIHRFDLSTMTDTEIYSGQAFAIGRMAPTPDGAGLLFSQIPNMEAWVAALIGGTAPEDPLTLFPVTLHYLDLSTGSVSPIASDVNMFAFNAAAVP